VDVPVPGRLGEARQRPVLRVAHALPDAVVEVEAAAPAERAAVAGRKPRISVAYPTAAGRGSLSGGSMTHPDIGSTQQR
jgi:hypothetical protein